MDTLVRYRMRLEMKYRAAWVPEAAPVDLSLVWEGECVKEEDVVESYVFQEYSPEIGLTTHPITGERVRVEDYL